MVSEYKIRKEEADRIARELEGLTYGVMVVGSVAYNQSAVMPTSDLDMVAVLDFATADWEEIHERLGVKPNPDVLNHARADRINNVSIIYDTEFEVRVHCWDGSAFESVTRLQGYNKVFRPESHDRDFVSLGPVDILRSPSGEETEIFKEPEEVEGGQIMRLYPAFTTEEDIYLGIQANNLILDPKVLCDRGKYLAAELGEFQQRLKAALEKRYEHVDLTEALPEKILGKLSPELEERLREFI